jgi:3-hydroxyacyl-CoA dehydrogenase
MHGRAIKKVCVIGAGVMGQGIAAHMVNSGLECMLLDIAAAGPNKSQIAQDAIKKIHNSKPSLIFTKAMANLIKPGNIEENLDWLKDCDLVIEAVLEQVAVKQGLYKKIKDYVGPQTIVASNTSGLSVAELCNGLDQKFAENFLVMHFFNPVRYLHLLEIVPSPKTKAAIIKAMIEFGENRLGKGVVVAKDTTNFIANRIGVFGMMEAMKAVTHDGYTIEEVDAVFGPALGRPKSAIFRTADVVGLDTFIHVAQNCYDNLTKDECRETFKVPEFMSHMVAKGWAGQKTGQGFYKKEGAQILALDLKTLKYRPAEKVRFESIGAIRNLSSLSDKIRSLAYADDRAGQLFFNLMAKTCVYAANRLGEIADTIADIDNALKWGFGWEMGPFESWDAMGVRKSVDRMNSMGIKVPAWVENMLKSGRENFYDAEHPQKLSPKEWSLESIKRDARKVIGGSDAYSLIACENGALIVEFHTKMNAIDNDVLKGINDGLDRCENGEFDALVLANEGKNFSVGANLLLLYMAAGQGMWDEIDQIVRLFQKTGQRLKYSSIPTVAAPFQLTFGGGCELAMWCDRIHADAETYIGLVEVGVGLIPGGGGTIEMLSRTLEGVIDTSTYVTEQLISRALETVAMAKVATSAEEAKSLLYLNKADSYSLNKRFLIHDAATLAIGMAHSGYIAPKKREFRLPGTNAYATFDMGLRAMLDGGFISEHDFKITMKVAHVMTGGATNSTVKVSEDYLLDLEREAFLSLCGEQKTADRIAYMLEHNKPLRN